jgi:hypothetical protein
MALSIISYPDDQLNGVFDCLKIEFGVDPADAQDVAGQIVDVVITNDILNLVQVGTICMINNLKITFHVGATDTRNLLGDVSNPLQAIADIITNNLLYDVEFTSASVTGTSVSLTPAMANQAFQVDFQNLNSSSAPNITLFFQSNPVKAHPGYQVKGYIYANKANERTGIFSALPMIQTNADKTAITSVNIEKDVSTLLRKFVNPIIPPINTSSPPPGNGFTNQMTDVVYINAAEAFGAPVSPRSEIFQQVADQWKIYYGGTRIGESLNDYANSLLNFDFQQEVNVVCEQPNWLWLYRKSSFQQITQRITAYDQDGNILGFTALNIAIGIPGDPDFDILYAASGFIQLRTILGGTGRNPDLIARYEVRLVVNDTAPATYTEFPVTYIVHRRYPNAVFVFRTSLGTLASIAVQGLDQQTMSVTQEFLEICTPCDAGYSFQRSRADKSESFIDLTFFLFEDTFYNIRLVEEFYSSSEVYLFHENELYYVEPNNQQTIIYDRNTLISPQYNCRIHHYKR